MWGSSQKAYLLTFNNATDAFASIKCKRPSSDAVAPLLINSITCTGVRDGSSAISFAARLATLGEAMEVPSFFILDRREHSSQPHIHPHTPPPCRRGW